MRQQRLELELRVTCDVSDIAQDGLVPCIVLDELVVGARRHAVGGGQHEIARQRDAAAEVSARAYNQRHPARDRVARRRRAADHGERQGCRTRKHEREEDAPH